MKLFDIKTDPNKNLLPKDGCVNYFGELMSQREADAYMHALLHAIIWRHDEVFMFGKKIITKRKVAWYGDRPFKYTYSKSTKSALPWTNELIELKKIIEHKTEESFNSCLLNLYHSGEEGMGWHCDAEKELKKNGSIASLSLGADRRFVFKHKKTNEKIGMTLTHGSLLLMKGVTQTYWLHSLPPVKSVNAPRINLTFRTIESS